MIILFRIRKGRTWLLKGLLCYKYILFHSILKQKEEAKDMKEIEVNNDLELKIYINGVPDLQQIPKDIVDRIIAALELHISNFYKSEKEKT